MKSRARLDFENLKQTKAFRRFINEKIDELDGRCSYCKVPVYWDEVVSYRWPDFVLRDNPQLPRSFVNRTWTYHVDHIVPLHRGGTNDCSNLTLSCASCNSRKGSKILAA